MGPRQVIPVSDDPWPTTKGAGSMTVLEETLAAPCPSRHADGLGRSQMGSTPPPGTAGGTPRAPGGVAALSMGRALLEEFVT